MSEQSEIPALTVWSDNFRPLFLRWSSTLPEGFVVCDKRIEVVQDGFGFKKDSWYQAIKAKVTHYADALSLYPEGHIVLCSDCDIFFPNKTKVLYEYAMTTMHEKDVDMLFMREGHTNNVNSGFIFVKNSESVRQAFRNSALHCDKRTALADQDYFNGEFRSLGVKWVHIDSGLMAFADVINDKNRVLFHHAICATNIRGKMQQQDRIAKTIGFEFPKTT